MGVAGILTAHAFSLAANWMGKSESLCVLCCVVHTKEMRGKTQLTSRARQIIQASLWTIRTILPTWFIISCLSLYSKRVISASWILNGYYVSCLKHLKTWQVYFILNVAPIKSKPRTAVQFKICVVINVFWSKQMNHFAIF